MPLQLSTVLRRLRTERKRAALKAGKPIAEWVFLTPEGTVVDGDNLRNRVFYRLLEKAGHSSIQVTVDIYGHLIPGANRAAVDKLDAARTHPHPRRIRGRQSSGW